MQRLQTRLYSLLRWSEKYTKTDMVYLTRGGFWSGAGQVATVVSSLALAVLVSRVLPKEVYGEYKYIVAIVGLLSVFSLNSLGSAVFQSTARGFDGALPEGFWINLRWSILMFVAAVVLCLYYLVNHNIDLALGILIGGCLTPLLTSANFASLFLAGKKDFARQSLYFGIFETLISVAALMVAVTLTHSALVLVAVYFISNTLATLYFYRRVISHYKPDIKNIDPGMLTYGKHLSVLGVLGGLVSELDQILLFHFVGPAQLAIYAFAIGIPDQSKGLLKNIDTMLQARFVNYFSHEIRKNMANKSLLLFIFAVVAIVVYIPLAPYIFRILFPAYMSAVPYTQVYILSFLSLPLAPAGSYLASKKLIKEIYINTIIGYATQIIAMPIGIIFWGLWGLVWSVVITRFLNGLSGYVLFLLASRRNAKI